MPSANATPSGTAISVVNTDSRAVWTTAACNCGLCSTELTGSLKYQRQEKPCHADCERPLLNENSTAMAIGTSDQVKYSHVNPSRSQGWPHGLRQGRRLSRLAASGACGDAVVAGASGCVTWSRPGVI